MKLLTAFAFFVLSLQFAFAKGFGCDLISEGSIPTICTTYIVIDNRHIPTATLDFRITLAGKRDEVRWFCGSKYGTFTWESSGKKANQIRVSFHLGIAHLSAYLCLDLSGPTRSGMRCSVDSITNACPGDRGSGSSCVYEEESFTSVEGRAKAGVAVKGTLAGVVRGKVEGSVTIITKVKYNSKFFVVIPAGMRFCTSIEAVSQVNSRAPTGYEWKCLASPKFSQEQYTGSCSSLTRCDGSLCSEAKPVLTSGTEAKPAVFTSSTKTKPVPTSGTKVASSAFTGFFIVQVHILLVSTVSYHRFHSF